MLGARERQAARSEQCGVVNARMPVGALRACARLDHRGDELLARAHDRGLLSARAHDRVLRVARSLADLAGQERIGHIQVAAALSMHTERGVAQRQARA